MFGWFGRKIAGDPYAPQPRKTFHGYAAATRVHPEWTPAYLVFQAGLPKSRDNSLTGGGQIYGHEFEGTFLPVTKAYTPGVNSLVGGGQTIALPPEIIALLGGQRGTGS